MGKVHRTESARQDLAEIWSFIAVDNFDAADRFIDRLEDVFSSLAETPMMGRSRSKDLLIPDLRSFPVNRYMIYYRPHEDGGVLIVRVRHAAQSTETLLDD